MHLGAFCTLTAGKLIGSYYYGDSSGLLLPLAYRVSSRRCEVHQDYNRNSVVFYYYKIAV